ncbi:response regulator transcription factor [Azospirillum thermophilum]|nr:response regulator transcription factor [Azospirillum thermophilum]
MDRIAHFLLVHDQPLVTDTLSVLLTNLTGGARISLLSDMPSLLRSSLPERAAVIGELRLLDADPLSMVHQLMDRAPDLRIVLTFSSAPPQLLQALLAAGLYGLIPNDLNGRATRAALSLVLMGERFIPAAILKAGRPGATVPPDAHRNPCGQRLDHALSRREQAILRMASEGLANRMIAGHLTISEKTVKAHLSSAYRKLGIRNRLQAACLLRDDIR